jgi:hypothetical protein
MKFTEVDHKQTNDFHMLQGHSKIVKLCNKNSGTQASEDS